MPEEDMPEKKSPIERLRRLGGRSSKQGTNDRFDADYDDTDDQATDLIPATGDDVAPESATAAVPVDDTVPGDDEPTEAIAVDPNHRHMSAATTRRVLGAVAIGAIVAAVATIFIAGGFKSDKDLSIHPPGDTPATGAVAGKAFGTAVQGDCLTWKNPDASDLAKVDCTKPHLFEVASEIDLSKFPGAEYGPGSKYPGVLRFSEIRDEQCNPAVNEYLGAQFDPHGKFDVGLINPGEGGWKAGERTIRCGLQFSSSTGAQIPVIGPVAKQDQSAIWDPGTCIGLNGNIPSDPVDCSQQHAFEVVGTIDLGAQFPGGPPPVEEQDKFLTAACADAAGKYLGSPDAMRNKTLTLFWDNPDSVSWLAGSKKVNCSVGKEAGPDTFAPIVNSAKGDILINGQPPVPPPAIPNGRVMLPPLPGAAPAPIPPAEPAPGVVAPPG